jgi:hypothetical protein
MFVRLLLYSQYVLIQLLGVNYSSSTNEKNLGDDLKHFAAEQERDLFEQCTQVCECVRSPPHLSLFSRFQVNLMYIKVESQIRRFFVTTINPSMKIPAQDHRAESIIQRGC